MCLKLVIIIIMSDYIQLWKPWTEIAHIPWEKLIRFYKVTPLPGYEPIFIYNQI
jgi:hypothetical protein